MTLSEAISSGQSSRFFLFSRMTHSSRNFVICRNKKGLKVRDGGGEYQAGVNGRAGGCRREGWAPLGCPWRGRRGARGLAWESVLT